MIGQLNSLSVLVGSLVVLSSVKAKPYDQKVLDSLLGNDLNQPNSDLSGADLIGQDLIGQDLEWPGFEWGQFDWC